METLIIVGGTILHKSNFIKALNKEGFFPGFEDIEAILEHDDNIRMLPNKNFVLTNDEATHFLPEDWDLAMEAFRNSPVY